MLNNDFPPTICSPLSLLRLLLLQASNPRLRLNPLRRRGEGGGDLVQEAALHGQVSQI